MDKYDVLKLDNQICFPLYACGKEITRLYKPYLDEIGLTYTQYITMMVVWELKEVTLKHLGERLYLDSGTLTPLLKKLEQKNFIKRSKDPSDDRNLIVSVTDEGLALRDVAINVPAKISGCVSITEEEAINLYKIINKILSSINK